MQNFLLVFLYYIITMKETKKNLESVESLQKQIEENAEKIRQMKRAESELNLQLAVEKMNDIDNPAVLKEVLRACYSFIAQHRTLLKKMPKGKPLPVTGAH